MRCTTERSSCLPAERSLALQLLGFGAAVLLGRGLRRGARLLAPTRDDVDDLERYLGADVVCSAPGTTLVGR